MPEMTEELKLGALGQVSRMVSDLPKAVAWYRDVLGLPLIGDFGNVALFDMGGVRLFLSRPEGDAPSGNSVLYFRVVDINATCEALKARGIAFRAEPHMIARMPDGTEEWMAFFDDMEGELLAVMSQVRS
jgi:catechol 2,3-dioxygenase-like lactoylglutathione lyase family enzyme